MQVNVIPLIINVTPSNNILLSRQNKSQPRHETEEVYNVVISDK